MSSGEGANFLPMAGVPEEIRTSAVDSKADMWREEPEHNYGRKAAYLVPGTGIEPVQKFPSDGF